MKKQCLSEFPLPKTSLPGILKFLRAFLCVGILMFSASSYAQTQQTSSVGVSQRNTVTGRVLDENGNGLIGATVVVVGTQQGATTGVDGSFFINGGGKYPFVLRVSYLGYESQELSITKEKTSLNITLKAKANKLDEVVVIGYGTSKKSDLTGSITNVKMSDIADVPVLSVDQALQGRIAGADIMSTTGEPGAGTSIRIRGTRSISASNEPLIVVDGVMDAISDLNDINSSDIASISILKDASSTAIYGSRGSNGVIIITTKKGRSLSGKPNITFKADVGFSQLPRKLDLMNAAEYAQYRNDYAYFSSGWENVTDGSPLADYPYPNPLAKGQGTNWIDEITRTAGYQNYNLSVSGSSKKTSYFVSLGYNDTEGIIQRSGLTRITGRINLDHQLFPWLKVSYQGSYTYRDQDKNLASIGGTNRSAGAIYLSPLLKPTDIYNPDFEDGLRINTPRATIDLNTNNEKRNTANHAISFEAKLAKGLKFKTQNSYYTFQMHQYRYYSSALPKKVQGEGGEARRGENDSFSLSSENMLTYTLSTPSGHHLNLLGGFTAYKYKSNSFSLEGAGYMDDEVMWNNMTGVADKNTYAAATGITKKTKMSWLARFNYNYKQRYYITFTGRYDGASNFAANNKWGFFPSAALKWNISNENFMKNVRWLNELSLRISAGRSGNDAIAAYRSLEKLYTTTDGYIFNGQQQASYYRQWLPSANLSWETTDLYNLALDLSLFGGRLNVTAEGYIAKTKDLLLDVQIANQSGYDTRFMNLGKTTNKGLELSIESFNIVKPKFSWTTNLTLAHNRQNVDDIGTSDFVATATSAGNNPYMMQGFVKGYPLNALWGFRYGGVWHNVEEFKRNEITHAYVSAASTVLDPTKYASNVGLPRYYDINNDGTLDQNDLVYLGDSDPYLYGGLQNTFSIGHLKVGVYFTYSLGGKIYNYSELYMAGGNRTNQYAYMRNCWHPIRNPNSDLPRAGGTLSEDVPSDRMVYDASYLRLKNVSIGYTFDLQKKTRLLRDITLSVSGENLWLWKKYNGFDPDVSSSDNSQLRRVDIGAYPKPRTIVFSIQVRY